MNVFDKPQLYEGTENYIFISYSHDSHINVYDILCELNNKGIRFWYDEGLQKGIPWENHVKEKMKKASSVWFFFDENFFKSYPLKKEVEFVQQERIPYAPIYYQGEIYKKIHARLVLADYAINADVEKLYSEMFADEITGIMRKDSFVNFIDELTKEATLLKTRDETQKVEVRNKNKVVAFIGKKRVFTAAVVEGVIKTFSENANVKLEHESIIPDNLISLDTQFDAILERVLNKNYDGVIVRPLGEMKQKTFDIFEQICKRTKVVLCDIDITSTQRKRLGKYAPVYVCSNFALGGLKIGSFINQLSFTFGKNLTDIFICVGPVKNQPSLIRSNMILEKLTSMNNIQTLELDSLNEKDSFEKIRDFLIEKCNHNIEDRHLIFYAGNDNVAHYLSKNLQYIQNEKINISDYKKIVILGYDGVKGATGNSILEESKYDYATIDTIPNKQGEVSANALLQLMKGEIVEPLIEVEPQLIKKVNYSPVKESKLASLRPLLNDVKLFIFDLDGTIADTETLHWEAYNILMKEKYGFELKKIDIKRYIGNSERSIYDMIEKDYGIEINKEQFLKERLAIYLNLIKEKNLKPFDWVLDFMKLYEHVPVLLLTSQVPEIVDYLLTYWNLDELIPKKMRISAHNGKVTKLEVFSNPQKYVSDGNIEKVGSVVVFEDSDHVAKLALDLGHIVVGISHSYNKDSLKHCSAILDQNLKKGLFVGLGGIDLVYYTKRLPSENEKVKTNKYEIKVGGPALNAAIACANLGGYATLLTSIGKNPLGKLVKGVCEKHGIRIIDITPDREIPNISAVAVNLDAATRTIISGQQLFDNIKMPSLSFFENFDYCLYDCNFPQYTKKLVQHLQENDVPLLLDCGAWKENIESALNYAFIAISSQNFISPNKENIFALKQPHKIDYIAQTRGEKSILYEAPFEKGEIKIEEKKNVNTLGAGDVLHGAFCYYFYNRKQDFKTALENASSDASKYIK